MFLFNYHVLSHECLITYELQAYIWSNNCPITTSHGPLTINHGSLTTNHGSLTTNHGPLTTSHGPLTTSHGPLTTNHGPLTTSHGPLTTSHGSLTTNCVLLTTNHGPLTTSHGPLTTNHGSLTTNHGSLTTNHCPLTTNHGSLTTDISVLFVRDRGSYKSNTHKNIRTHSLYIAMKNYTKQHDSCQKELCLHTRYSRQGSCVVRSMIVLLSHLHHWNSSLFQYQTTFEFFNTKSSHSCIVWYLVRRTTDSTLHP